MNLETIFEELETQFEIAEANSARPAIQATRLATTVGGVRIALERPIFGDSFVAGVLSGKAVWRFQPHKTMAVFRLELGEVGELPTRCASEVLETSLVGRFIRYSLISDSQQVRKARVHSVSEGLILFEPAANPTGVAIERLAWLEVHAGDN